MLDAQTLSLESKGTTFVPPAVIATAGATQIKLVAQAVWVAGPVWKSSAVWGSVSPDYGRELVALSQWGISVDPLLSSRAEAF
jgi:hypothetical protein